VCNLGAFNFFGGDHMALWTNHPIPSHTSALPQYLRIAQLDLIRRFHEAPGWYAKTPQDRRRDVAKFDSPALVGCQCHDGRAPRNRGFSTMCWRGAVAAAIAACGVRRARLQPQRSGQHRQFRDRLCSGPPQQPPGCQPGGDRCILPAAVGGRGHSAVLPHRKPDRVRAAGILAPIGDIQRQCHDAVLPAGHDQFMAG
jgi:hypothetical protein